MSVLSRQSLVDALTRLPANDPLVVTPLLEENQIGSGSIDLRLGHEFIILKRASIRSIDAANAADWSAALFRSQERVRVATGKEFVIHPGELILGATLEYISVPRNVAASVEGRSSWGRLGLFIATATLVAPGFKGCITLELVNSGAAPLVLYPRVRIAQLILQTVDRESVYTGKKYYCATGPEFSRINEDPELPWLRSKGR